MYSVTIVLIFLICLLLTIIVLVQNPKGGGLSSSFSNSNQILGVRRTTDFLEKATWWLAGLLLGFCILASAFIPNREVGSESSVIKEQIETAVDPSQVPSFPAATPAEEAQPAAEGEAQPAAAEEAQPAE